MYFWFYVRVVSILACSYVTLFVTNDLTVQSSRNFVSGCSYSFVFAEKIGLFWMLTGSSIPTGSETFFLAFQFSFIIAPLVMNK
jgi:hypothetical protein